MTDRLLIEAAQAGQREAFSALIEREYDVMFRIAMQWCGVREDAEDIAQQASIKLAQSIGQFRFESAFRTWLYRLVINCAKDWQQSQARHQRQRVQAPGDEGTDILLTIATEDKTDVAIYLDALLLWVASLGDGFRETLLLVFGEGLNHREAAEVLDVKESTVSWRIHEVRKKLKTWRVESGGEP
jgi:RNA polymerase sigma-70 factor, ECF subfamily